MSAGVSAEAERRVVALAARHELPPTAAPALMALVALVADDDTAPTSVRGLLEAVDVHLADSLVALELPEVRAARVIADLGAGAGFPGLPLAIALPAAHVHLVESVGRKCDFIERAADVAAVANATVVRARAEEWREGLGACDLVTARALAPLAVLLEYAAPLLAPGGALVAWKGRRSRGEELAAGEAAAILGMELASVLAVRPYEGAQHRHLHLYLKVGSTPNRFPRRAGMARKRPLAGGPRAGVEGSGPNDNRHATASDRVRR